MKDLKYNIALKLTSKINFIKTYEKKYFLMKFCNILYDFFSKLLQSY